MKPIHLLPFLFLLLIGCGKPQGDLFWYPKAFVKITCTGFEKELYVMTHNQGWRSWPYYLDPEDKKEVTFTGCGCTIKTLKKLPEYKRAELAQMNDEQKLFMVRGF